MRLTSIRTLVIRTTSEGIYKMLLSVLLWTIYIYPKEDPPKGLSFRRDSFHSPIYRFLRGSRKGTKEAHVPRGQQNPFWELRFEYRSACNGAAGEHTINDELFFRGAGDVTEPDGSAPHYQRSMKSSISLFSRVGSNNGTPDIGKAQLNSPRVKTYGQISQVDSLAIRTKRDLYALLECSKKNDVEGLLDILRSVFRTGFIDSSLEPDRHSALHVAAMWGHSEVVRILLGFGASIHLRNLDNETALLVAAKEGHANVVRLLLENMADVDDVDSELNSSLHLSAPHSEVTRLLLQNGARLNAVNEKGRTPLHEACQRGCPVVVQLLLEYSRAETSPVSDEASEESWMSSAVHEAGIRGKFQAVPQIQFSNTSRAIEATDKSGDTPLHVAAYWGNDSIVSLLVKHNPPFSAVNKEGRTPLEVAKYRVPSRRSVTVIEDTCRMMLGEELVNNPHLIDSSPLLRDFAKSVDFSVLVDLVENQLPRSVSPATSRNIYQCISEGATRPRSHTTPSPPARPLVPQGKAKVSYNTPITSPQPFDIHSPNNRRGRTCVACAANCCVEHQQESNRMSWGPGKFINLHNLLRRQKKSSTTGDIDALALEAGRGRDDVSRKRLGQSLLAALAGKS
ncbi:putative ankyrin repeat-containing protein [Planoprotostelium fungivorum]|uniref:Putative ankyrin repeat-containing protein n=1 Tax=Planoprotostelium fungivorum TaxID=1890364 RepID=A0A2P6N8Z2_9EUKA|nr:putative ankyrin repeat-containing protein [Planoprotostelium fungivorum]